MSSNRNPFWCKAVIDGTTLDPDGNPTIVAQDGSISTVVLSGPGNYRVTQGGQGPTWTEDQCIVQLGVQSAEVVVPNYDWVSNGVLDVYFDDVGGGGYGPKNVKFSLLIMPTQGE